jgi:hypothetical protein
MKIRATVEQLTPAQWDWLLANVRQEWAFLPEDVRVCVEFANPDERLGEHRHMEIELRAWSGVMRHLNEMSRTAEAVLTPDVLPEPGLDERRIGTNTGHGHVWARPDGMRARCGGQALCGKCREDAKLFERNGGK